MRPTIYRRVRRHPASREAASNNKDRKNENSFFSESTHDPFFKASNGTTAEPVVQLKPSDSINETTQIHRMDDKKEEDKKVNRKTEEEEKVQKKDEEKVMKKEEKEEENKKEEPKLQRKESATSSQSTSGNYLSSLHGKGNPLPAKAKAFFSSRMGYDFSDVKVHNGKEAADSAKGLNAKAYTVGNDIVFNEGQLNTDTSEGKKLMAHELTHVVQQGEIKMIRRDAEVNAAGNYTGNYIFNPGHDGLNSSFFNRVKRNVDDGTLDDVEITALRTDAIARNGTIMHVELLLMAAMRNPVNVTLMQAHRTGSLIIPMNQISRADQDYLTNFGREEFPVDIAMLNLRLLAATLGISNERFEDVAQELSIAAEHQIMQNAGTQFADQAQKLVINAEFSEPRIPLSNILMAMLNGASDSTSGDKVMAGTVYAVAQKANHPTASQILSGALKVDALIPSVYQRIIGGGDAAYVYSTDTNVLKSDTLYVPTSLDIFALDSRALIIHELTHAADDFATVGRQQIDSLRLETHAYKEQGKYMMDQILADLTAVGNISTASSYSHSGPLFYWSMVAAAKDDTARYSNVLVTINAAAPMSKPEANIRTDLGLSAATINARVRTELLAFTNSSGQHLYQAGTTNVEGRAGHYFH
ncbi:MAG TPA: DUF4157 domain-containing protein [Prolixibacteraceae bacterium]|nr:DUF4157 domain-containing protein [Prolixibacteraceae bacterium]